MPKRIHSDPEAARLEHQRNYQRFYRRGGRMKQVSEAATEGREAIPTESMTDLLSLDMSIVDNRVRFSRGLRFHMVAGNVMANEAAQLLRQAEAEAELSKKRPQGAPLAGRFAKAAGGEGGKRPESSSKDPAADPSPPVEGSPDPGSLGTGGEGLGASPSSACAEGRPSEGQAPSGEVGREAGGGAP